MNMINYAKRLLSGTLLLKPISIIGKVIHKC